MGIVAALSPRLDAHLAERLALRLERPLPSVAARRRFEPELSYGRHFAPPRDDARRAVVIALLFRSGGEWQLPLTLRPPTMRNHAGQISLPGGAIDPGETPEVAALRELDEELGIQPADVRLLGPLSPLNLYVTQFAIQPYLAVAGDEPAFRISPAEVHELVIVPVRELLDRQRWRRHELYRFGMDAWAPSIVGGRHAIWGASAIILGEVIALIEDAAVGCVEEGIP